MLGLSAPGFMRIVGVIEIIAGIGVAVRPRIFSYVVSAWLLGIIINLLILGSHFDIALRDLGSGAGDRRSGARASFRGSRSRACLGSVESPLSFSWDS
jgi:hypothetical protein